MIDLQEKIIHITGAGLAIGASLIKSSFAYCPRGAMAGPMPVKENTQKITEVTIDQLDSRQVIVFPVKHA